MRKSLPKSDFRQAGKGSFYLRKASRNSVMLHPAPLPVGVSLEDSFSYIPPSALSFQAPFSLLDSLKSIGKKGQF